jgi:hypothetical protein
MVVRRKFKRGKNKREEKIKEKNIEERKKIKRGLERSFGSHTGHKTAGKVRSFIVNQVTEFKNSYFWTY